MFLRSRQSAAEHGYTLLEALISLGLVVLILVGASQLLFATRHAADRVSLHSEVRQVSRRALEYVGHHIRSASDLNRSGGNPMAIVTWFELGGASVQASHNNVTDPLLADPGTDILTVAAPTLGLSIPCDEWPGFGAAANVRWHFDLACPDPQANVDLFMEMTGYNPATGMSGPLLLTDAVGQTAFYQITNYHQGENRGQSCQPDPQTGRAQMHVGSNPGLSDTINPPGGQPTLVQPVYLQAGVKLIAFRVRNGWLEQKQGLFNPGTDNPGTEFTRVLPNIEDLQIAWLFRDGSMWNNTTQQLATDPYVGNVPSQGTTHPYDVRRVLGLRLTLTARSSVPMPREIYPRYQRPPAEDHWAGDPDRFYHDRSSELVMIRNRSLQW